jgi:hypothetical protein
MINFFAGISSSTLRHSLILVFISAIPSQVLALESSEWEYGCNDQQRCHTFINGEGIRIAFAKEANSTVLKGAVAIPTVSSASQPVTLRLDSGVEMRLTVSSCNDQFCEARIDSSKSLLVIEQLLKAKKVTVAYLNGDAIQVVTLPLAGFKSSFKTLDELLNYRIDAEIKTLLDQWSTAWSNGDIESYLSFYDATYVGSKFSTRADWAYNRGERISPEKGIGVTLSNTQVTLKDLKTVAQATFRQQYKTTQYQDDTKKELTFKRVGNGWKIIGEQTRLALENWR